MPNLVYTVSDFLPFTKIVSADVNSRFNDIKVLLNTTGLNDTNIQNNSITRATKLSLGTANYVVINNGSGQLSEEAALAISRGGLGQAFSLTNQAGKAIVVSPGETTFSLGTPTVDRITEILAADISSLTAGESILAGDAVCLALGKDASNNDIYRVFKTDSDLPDRRNNFLGFAVSAATVVAGTYTWTDSAALVASNVITWKINNRHYIVSIILDNDTTLAAIATMIATDQDIQSAAVVDAGSNDRVINVTGKGGLFINITVPLVTGGASQATITIANTQAPSGQAVTIRCFGPFTTSGLTLGYNYYLSGTAGGITNTPTDSNPLFVGQALSTTILFVNRHVGSFQFSTPSIFVRSHGGSTGTTAANYQFDVEHFNFTSWSAGTSEAVSKLSCLACGESNLNGFLVVVDGFDSTSVVSSRTRLYNKSAWSSAPTNRSDPRCSSGVAAISNNLYFGFGSEDSGASTAQPKLEKFTGNSWSNQSDFGDSLTSTSCFFQGGLGHWVGGISNIGGSANSHYTYNGSAISTATNWPVSNQGIAGNVAAGSIGLSCTYTGTGYTWNGSTWSSSISVGYVTSGNNTNNQGPGCGFNAGSALSYFNGGSSGIATSINTSSTFNGTSFSSTTSSTNARSGGQGSVY